MPFWLYMHCARGWAKLNHTEMHILTNSHGRSCFMSLPLSNYPTPWPIHATSHYTSCPGCIGAFVEKLEKEVLLRQTNPPSSQKWDAQEMNSMKCLWDRRFQGGSSGERKIAFSELGEDDKFNVVFLSSVFITPYVGAHNRLAQATRG